MGDFISRLTAFLRSKDELCGEWITEDGTGFSIIMGSWIEFKANGTGKYKSWSNSKDDSGYNFNAEFIWKRMNKDQIEITDLASQKKETINYKLQKVNNRIELSNVDNSNSGMEEFWNFAQIIFRKK